MRSDVTRFSARLQAPIPHLKRCLVATPSPYPAFYPRSSSRAHMTPQSVALHIYICVCEYENHSHRSTVHFFPRIHLHFFIFFLCLFGFVFLYLCGVNVIAVRHVPITKIRFEFFYYRSPFFSILVYFSTYFI